MRNILRNKAFTLVEVTIAGILSTIVFVFMMQLMSSFYKTTDKFTGKVVAARDSNIILQRVKMIIRGAKEVDASAETMVSGSDAFGNAFDIRYMEGEKSLTIDKKGEPALSKGKGKIYDFRVTQPLKGYPHIFKIKVLYENPEARSKTIENAMEFSTIASIRIPSGARIPDKAWVNNDETECPPSCGGDS